jgi:heat shock protein HtpX
MNPDLWYQHALLNRLQSFLLLSAMGGFLALLGWLIWGGQGILLLLATGSLLILVNPAATPGWIMRLYRASPLTPAQAPTLSRILTELSRRAELPFRPALYYIPSRMVNAITVGKGNEAVIAVTDGLLRSLDTREIAGVLAHEVSHIRSNDMWVMGIADLFSRLTSILSLFGQMLLLMSLPFVLVTDMSINWFAILLLIFAPTLSALAQLGLSRTREYDADLNAARLTGDPEGLALALVKIEGRSDSLLERVLLPGRHLPEPSLLRTHPATRNRVHRLMELEQAGLFAPSYTPLRQEGIIWNDFPGQPVRRIPRWHINGLWH